MALASRFAPRSSSPSSGSTDHPTARRLVTIIAWAAGAAVLAAFFLGAPTVLMRARGSASDAELVRMSNVGQAYGGLSALLSGIATGGVAAALLLQVRQIRLTRAHSVRMLQIELMSMLVQRPELRPVSPTLSGVGVEQRQRDIYTNLILRYLEMGYETGYFTTKSVVFELQSQFAIDDIRHFWERTRAIHLSGVMNKAQLKFANLVEEAYRHTEPVQQRKLQPTPERTQPREPSPRSRRGKLAVAVAAGTVVAIAVVRAHVRNQQGQAGGVKSSERTDSTKAAHPARRSIRTVSGLRLLRTPTASPDAATATSTQLPASHL